jgi:hypothetical protein
MACISDKWFVFFVVGGDSDDWFTFLLFGQLFLLLQFL